MALEGFPLHQQCRVSCAEPYTIRTGCWQGILLVYKERQLGSTTYLSIMPCLQSQRQTSRSLNSATKAERLSSSLLLIAKQCCSDTQAW